MAWHAYLSPQVILIGVTGIAFILQSAVENAGSDSERFVRTHLALSLDGLMRLEIWQLLTHALLHGGISHLFFNMLALFVFGSVAEGATTRTEFFRFYLLAALGGGVAYIAWAAAGFEPGWMPVVGASGAVTGILVLAAVRVPRARILVFFVLPVSIWLLAMIYVGMDVATALSGQTGGVAVSAHIGGALTAVLYQYRPWRRFLPSRRAAASRVRPSILRSDLPPDLLPPAPAGGATQREAERVDALLQRIHDEGIGSLTDEEREFLNEVSRRMRGR